MTRDHDANHVRAVRAANSTPRIFISKAFRHPGIRTRFADWDCLQDFPGAQLKRRAYRRERDIELKLFARKILSDLLARCREMTMFTRDNIRSQSLSQDR